MRPLFLLFLLVVLAGCVFGPQTPREVSFTDAARQVYAPSAQQLNVVVNSQAEWDGLWTGLFKASKSEVVLDNVDFRDETLFALFLGEKNTGGYSIRVTKIEETRDSVRVYYHAASPEPGSVVTQSFTTPFHIVKTKKINKPAVFQQV